MDRKNIKAEEPIVRYIFSKSHFSIENHRAKYGAFVPPRASDEVSVYRIIDLEDDEIWRLGDEKVAVHVEKDIKARADLGVHQVIDIGLEVIPETKPHPRHANIMGWPDDRDEIRQLAIELAESSSFSKRPAIDS